MLREINQWLVFKSIGGGEWKAIKYLTFASSKLEAETIAKKCYSDMPVTCRDNVVFLVVNIAGAIDRSTEQ
jgi:hypothetical protein